MAMRKPLWIIATALLLASCNQPTPGASSESISIPSDLPSGGSSIVDPEPAYAAFAKAYNATFSDYDALGLVANDGEASSHIAAHLVRDAGDPIDIDAEIAFSKASVGLGMKGLKSFEPSSIKAAANALFNVHIDYDIQLPDDLAASSLDYGTSGDSTYRKVGLNAFYDDEKFYLDLSDARIQLLGKIYTGLSDSISDRISSSEESSSGFRFEPPVRSSSSETSESSSLEAQEWLNNLMNSALRPVLENFDEYLRQAFKLKKSYIAAPLGEDIRLPLAGSLPEIGASDVKDMLADANGEFYAYSGGIYALRISPEPEEGVEGSSSFGLLFDENNFRQLIVTSSQSRDLSKIGTSSSGSSVNENLSGSISIAQEMTYDFLYGDQVESSIHFATERELSYYREILLSEGE